MTLKTDPETGTDPENGICKHHWILPSHISLTSWEETCIKCSTVRQVAPNPKPKQRSPWQRTNALDPPHTRQTTPSNKETTHHMSNTSEHDTLSPTGDTSPAAAPEPPNTNIQQP